MPASSDAPAPVELRRARATDARAMAAGIIAGLETYHAFADQGWTPLPVEEEAAKLAELLPTRTVWCQVAEREGRIVGQVMWMPGSECRAPVHDPRFAHLRNLFVDEDHWGTGLATALLVNAIEAARDLGFKTMRLFTPAPHARARRFYEPEGWVPFGDPEFAPEIGLSLVELRRTI